VLCSYLHSRKYVWETEMVITVVLENRAVVTIL
jgi:hypothetical protein